MIIHFYKTCSALDYEDKVSVDEYKPNKWGIKITLNDQDITIPFSNILAIEEDA